MGRSPVLFMLRLMIAGLLVAASSLLLAPMASADAFTSTFHLGSINVADFTAPPPFIGGPYNYGFSSLGLDPTVVGQVTITSISVSTDAIVNSTNPNFGNSTAFDWEIFVGPSPFGFTPGQVNGTSVPPHLITSSAPTQFRFAQLGGTMTLTGSYDFTSSAFVTNTGNFLKFAGTSPGDFANGLYAQVFMWTEAGVNLDFNNIAVTVNGNVVPEPSSILLLGTGVLSLMVVLRRKLKDGPQA
jgi:PEP-CTERM motif-containing protein